MACWTRGRGNTLFLFLIISAVFAGCGKGNEKKNAMPSGTKRAKKSRKQQESKYPGMVYIPAGEFTMGTDPEKELRYDSSLGFMEEPYTNEIPQRKVYLGAYYIDRYEVTIGQYAEFTRATGREMPEALESIDLEHFKDYPVSCVTWQDAADYATWAHKRLPTEAEWEKAARGTDGRRYPWGNGFDESKANFSKRGLFPVGHFKSDVSPYGVYDMAGSLDEWVEDWYVPYPGNTKKDPNYGIESKVYRGGSWGGLSGHLELFEYFTRTAFRGYEEPDVVSNLKGFRCVIEEQ